MPQATIPNPRTWSVNDLIKVPLLRADVSDAVAFLANRPAFTGQNNTGASWSNNADNNLGLNVELNDAWNGHVTTTTNGAVSSQYWAPVPGWYLVRSAVAPAFSTPAAPFQIAGGFNWLQNGVAQSTVRGGIALVGPGGGNESMVAQTCDLIEQVNSGSPGGGGDYIQPTFFQVSGASLNLSNGAPQIPTVSVRWVCATSGTAPLPVPPLTAVPSPITSAWMNANVRDAIRFLIYPPVCKAYYVAGSATLPSGSLGSPSVVDLTNVAVDNYGGFTTGASAGYAAPVAGIYQLYGQINLGAQSVATQYACGLTVNGGTPQWGDIVTFAPSSALAGGVTVSRRLRLNAGDTVQLVATQGSGSAVAYANGANNQTRFIAVWESS